jgi:hypothetical protein
MHPRGLLLLLPLLLGVASCDSGNDDLPNCEVKNASALRSEFGVDRYARRIAGNAR